MKVENKGKLILTKINYPIAYRRPRSNDYMLKAFDLLCHYR